MPKKNAVEEGFTFEQDFLLRFREDGEQGPLLWVNNEFLYPLLTVNDYAEMFNKMKIDDPILRDWKSARKGQNND